MNHFRVVRRLRDAPSISCKRRVLFFDAQHTCGKESLRLRAQTAAPWCHFVYVSVPGASINTTAFAPHRARPDQKMHAWSGTPTTPISCPQDALYHPPFSRIPIGNRSLSFVCVLSGLARRTSTAERHPYGRRGPTHLDESSLRKKTEAICVAYATYIAAITTEPSSELTSRDRRCPAEAKPQRRALHSISRL